jgi:DNA-binding PadR family transcriptional regulator
VGFAANRRLLDVQRLSHDCHIGEEAIARVSRSVEVRGQRASALRVWDPMVQALFQLLVLLRLVPQGFYCRDARQELATLLGESPGSLSQGRMTYQLRRLKLHGLIERLPKSHRYRVTPLGLRTALFFSRVHARILRPGLSHILSAAPPGHDTLRPDFERLEAAIMSWVEQARLSAAAVDC